MMQYRPHIDGLRAVAVVSVIIFHLDSSLLKGGFIGVDIFFVISGYLISSLIWSELKTSSSFSFLNFYIRRARRLLPALFATLILCSVCALFVYSSAKLNAFGRELIYSIVSLANFLFWSEAGYFDTASESKTLLHMWSLSVEEQFYLIWPIILVFAWKWAPNVKLLPWLILLIFAGVLANILLNHYELTYFPNQIAATFYLMPFRGYELVIGSLGYWIAQRMSSSQFLHELLFCLGSLAVLWSVVMFNETTIFPYYYALLPCAGTLMLILAHRSTLSRLFLGNRLMVFIGMMSYTLYLVHWPTIVFIENWVFDELTSIHVLGALCVILTISLGIYFGVEKPLRGKHHSYNSNTNAILLNGCLAAGALLVLFACAVLWTSGFSSLKKDIFTSVEIKKGKSNRYSLIDKACRVQIRDHNCKNDASKQVLIFGNSHEPDGYNIFHELYHTDERVNLILFGGINRCNLEYDEHLNKVVTRSAQTDCKARFASLYNTELIKSLDVIVFSANRPFAANKRMSWLVFKYIQKVNPNIQVLVIGTYFNTNRECAEISNKFGTTDACKLPKYVTYRGLNELEKIPSYARDINFVYLSKFNAMCGSKPIDIDLCITRTATEPMFYDQHHLSLSFSQLIAFEFSSLYSNALANIGLDLVPEL